MTIHKRVFSDVGKQEQFDLAPSETESALSVSTTLSQLHWPTKAHWWLMHQTDWQVHWHTDREITWVSWRLWRQAAVHRERYSDRDSWWWWQPGNELYSSSGQAGNRGDRQETERDTSGSLNWYVKKLGRTSKRWNRKTESNVLH